MKGGLHGAAYNTRVDVEDRFLHKLLGSVLMLHILG